MTEIARHVFVVLPLAALLVAAPAALNSGKLVSYDAAYAAAGGNGKGKGGADGQGGSNSASANSQGGGASQGNKNGQSDVKVANGQLESQDNGNQLGRLNAFMNASSNALLNASPKSAIGIISIQYRDAISAYLDGVSQGQVPAPTLDGAAAILAQAANKTLTPEIVAAINVRLAAENPDNLGLANFANPTADPLVDAANTQLATDLATLANTLQETEANQGLGPLY
jgi:hypothetical protein